MLLRGIMLIIIATLYVILYKKRDVKNFAIYLLLLIVISGVISGYVVDHIPEPKEKIIITALDEKNSNAKNSEIYLTKILIDGEVFELKKPVEGKWFWKGASYCWRNEKDVRKPDDITQRIEIEIPIGKERKVQFLTNIYKGRVSIEAYGKTTIYDCYSKENEILSAKIGSTSAVKINIYKTVLLSLFTILVIGQMYFYLKIIEKIRRDGGKEMKNNKKSRGDWFSENWDLIFCGVVLIFHLLFVINCSSLQSFWGDEIQQLGGSRAELTIQEVVHYNTTFSDATPPLYSILLHLWLKIAPYGIEWLLLPNQLGILIGIIFMGLTGYLIKGRRLAVIIVLIGSMSSFLINYASLELRSYALFFMFSAIIMYYYFKLYQDLEVSRKNIIKFALLLTLLLYSHLHGSTIVGTLFIVECLLYWQGRQKKHLKIIFSFLISFLLFLPYLGTVFINGLKGNLFYSTQNPGTNTPDFSVFNSIFINISSNELIYFLLILALSFSIIGQKEKNSSVRIASFLFIFCILGTFIISLIAESSYMKYRYYVGLLPWMFLVIASFIETGLVSVCEILKKPKVDRTILIFLTMYLFLNCSYNVLEEQKKVIQPFDEAAEYISSQADYYSPDVIVLLCGRDPMRFGWEYYLTEGGKKDKRLVLSWSNEDDKEKLVQYNKIYIYYPYSISDGFQKYLNSMGFKKGEDIKNLRIMIYER